MFTRRAVFPLKPFSSAEFSAAAATAFFFLMRVF
jgi:hypothetical protein